MKNQFGPLQELFDKKTVSEIIVDSFDDVYWEEGGKLLESQSIFKNSDEILEVIKNLFKSVGRSLDSMSDGFGDIRLADGTRVAATMAPISINGPSLVIRKMPPHNVTVEDFIKWGAIDGDGWKICDALMKSGKNVLLAGSAGCGKTTSANLLIDAIDKGWRVVTAEKVSELNTKGRKRTLRLETPNAKSHEMIELVKKTKLLRADTLVVNELMGAETFEVINFMREGVSVLATITAEAVTDALKKCELFCLMGQYGIGIEEIKYHIGSGVDAVIFQERLPSGKRVISNISLVHGVDENGKYEIEPLYTYDDSNDEFMLTKNGKEFLK